MRTAFLIASLILGTSSVASAQSAPVQRELSPELDGTDAATASEPSDARVEQMQRELQRRGRRQMLATPGVLAAGTPLLVLGPIYGPSSTTTCERNKSTCSTYTVSDLSSIGDDAVEALGFSAATSALAGTGMLFAIGARNRQLSRLDLSADELRQARGRMLEQYGRRTQWAGAGVFIAGALAASVGGILYATNIGDCELYDCKTVPGATRTIVSSAFIAGVTGTMMLGVGTATRKRGERAQEEDLRLSLSFAPWFDHRGGSGATLAMTW